MAGWIVEYNVGSGNWQRFPRVFRTRSMALAFVELRATRIRRVPDEPSPLPQIGPVALSAARTWADQEVSDTGKSQSIWFDAIAGRAIVRDADDSFDSERGIILVETRNAQGIIR